MYWTPISALRPERYLANNQQRLRRLSRQIGGLAVTDTSTFPPRSQNNRFGIRTTEDSALWANISHGIEVGMLKVHLAQLALEGEIQPPAGGTADFFEHPAEESWTGAVHTIEHGSAEISHTMLARPAEAGGWSASMHRVFIAGRWDLPSLPADMQLITYNDQVVRVAASASNSYDPAPAPTTVLPHSSVLHEFKGFLGTVHAFPPAA